MREISMFCCAQINNLLSNPLALDAIEKYHSMTKQENNRKKAKHKI